MNSMNASASGKFEIGDTTINRFGYGAITGPGVYGPPPDRNAALATFRRLPESGVNFIERQTAMAPMCRKI